MASILKYQVDPFAFQEEIRHRDELAEEERRIQFRYARKIQAWFRGIVTRSHICMLHKMATTIQRHWRGYRARVYVENYIEKAAHEMWWKHYHAMATRIQAVWRGYRARKCGIDLYKMRQWLHAVYDKNEEVLSQMKSFREAELEYVQNVMEQESMVWILYILFKLHHLIGTRHRDGIVTHLDKTRFTAIEEMMRCLEYTSYMEKKRRDHCGSKLPPAPPLLLEGTYFERCEREIREFEKDLSSGKVPIFRTRPYGADEKRAKEMERTNEQLLKKYSRRPPFRTFAKVDPPPYDKRLLTETRHPANRPPPSQGVSKHPGGDFKLIVKSNELYRAIEKTDCHFSRFKMNCPIHNLDSIFDA